MKRFLKRSLSVLLAITIILSSAAVGLGEIDFSELFAVKAKAAYSGKCGTNVTWSYNGETLTISGTGAMRDYDAPSSRPWNQIIGIKTVVIDDGVTSIGSYTFSDFENLSSVTIPDSVTSIGDFAFYECYGLRSITIPDSVISVGKSAFTRCNFLSIIIPDSVMSIGDYAFCQCENLLTITLSDSVASIGDYAFTHCSKLATITIPNSVTSIGAQAFSECDRLASINVVSENIYYTSVDGVLFNKDKTTLIQYPTGKTGTSYIIPDSVTSIGDYAFYCCNLRSVTIPGSAMSIGDYAFNCCNLRSVTIPGSVMSIGEDAFGGCYNLASIDVDSENLYYTSLDGVLFNDDKTTLIQYPAGKTKNTYIIPESVTSIGDYAFLSDEVAALNSITVPKSVTSIGKSAFGSFSSIYNVFYKGALEDWIAITIGSNNSALTYANIHFESTGHYSPNWIIGKEATVYKAGSKYKECTQCGKVFETAEIPQLKCSKPKLQSIENTEYGVLTKWSKVTGADKYRVYRKTSKSDWKYIGTTSKTYYTDKTAKSGTKYYYAVKSQNEAGNSSLSSSLSKYYLADPILKTPSSTKSGVKLTWSKVTGSEGYMVYRKTGTGSYSRIATVKGSTKVTYTDKSAKKGKKYTYKIKAYKSKTYSAYSNTKTITDKY